MRSSLFGSFLTLVSLVSVAVEAYTNANQANGIINAGLEGRKIISSSSVSELLYAQNEKREQDTVWEEISKNCVGCWSGSINHYDYKRRTNKLTLIKECPKKMNFRLSVDLDEENESSGTWTVHNVMFNGDTRVIHIVAAPKIQPMSHKIGFDGLIARITRKDIIYLEVGFWGESMRRTVVASYVNAHEDSNAKQNANRNKNKNPLKFLRLPKRRKAGNRLLNISCVQQTILGAEETKNFAGGNAEIIDDGYLDLMPDNEEVSNIPFFNDEINVDDFVPMESVSVNLITYEREMKDNFNEVEIAKIQQSILRPLQGKKKNKKCFEQITQPGVFVSLPKKLSKNGDEKFIFAHQKNDGTLKVLEVVYSMSPFESTKATVYSFSLQKELK